MELSKGLTVLLRTTHSTVNIYSIMDKYLATDYVPIQPIKGRGALHNPDNRYSSIHSERHFDHLEYDDDENGVATPKIPTQLMRDSSKTIITTNKSPDIPFHQSINPYKGCEHGCIYCFARPTHAYWDLSPGLDFETKILYKPEGPELLERALTKKGYQCSPIAFGTNTDPYQPIDKQMGITRKLLQVLQRFRHPFTIVTKGSHLLRDLDILEDMAKDNLCAVFVSVTTLDNDLKRILEPRAASAQTRLATIKTLADRGIPVGVLVAPVIPMINDREMEGILEACAAAGAQRAGHLFIRLPREVKDLFHEWLHAHFPDRAKHVVNLIRQSRGGADNVSEYGRRMRGEGVFGELLNNRFQKTCERLGLNKRDDLVLDCNQFAIAMANMPPKSGNQLALF